MEKLNYSPQLLRLCRSSAPDLALMEKFLQEGVSLNTPFGEVVDGRGGCCQTSYLMQATENTRYDAVKLLLKYGADPNLGADDEYPLWDLQYDFCEPGQRENRLRIAELLLRHGADPLIMCDNEPLLDYVCYKVFNDWHHDEYDQYICQFFLLLIIFGGTSRYCTPEIRLPFDRDNVWQYKFYILEHESGRGVVWCNSGWRREFGCNLVNGKGSACQACSKRCFVTMPP